MVEQKAIQEDRLTLADAKKYLTLYLGPADWDSALKRLMSQLRKYKSSPTEQMREIVSCAILLPVYTDTRVPQEPTTVLFWAKSPSNLELRNWYQTLKDEMVKDVQLEKNRQIVSSSGLIHPIDYSPLTRQAFNWMFLKGKEIGHINDQNKHDVEQRYKTLISIYGGQVICSLFQKNTRTNPVLTKVINWYTGYFIERLIYSTFDLTQVMKIKEQELKKTNKSLIKQLTLQ